MPPAGPTRPPAIRDRLRPDPQPLMGTTPMTTSLQDPVPATDVDLIIDVLAPLTDRADGGAAIDPGLDEALIIQAAKRRAKDEEEADEEGDDADEEEDDAEEEEDEADEEEDEEEEEEDEDLDEDDFDEDDEEEDDEADEDEDDDEEEEEYDNPDDADD